MKKTPADVLILFETLPQELLDEINIKLVIFSGLYMIEKYASKKPSKKQFAKILSATATEQVRLLREAGKKHAQSTK